MKKTILLITLLATSPYVFAKPLYPLVSHKERYTIFLNRPFKLSFKESEENSLAFTSAKSKLSLSSTFEVTSKDTDCENHFIIHNILGKDYNSLKFKNGCVGLRNKSNISSSWDFVIILPHSTPFRANNGDTINSIVISGKNYDAKTLLRHIHFTVSPKNYLLSIIELLKESYIFKNKVDWKSLEKKSLRLISGKTNLCFGTKTLKEFILPILFSYDNHSWLGENSLPEKKECQSQENRAQNLSSNDAGISDHASEWIRNSHADIIEGVGYLYLPSFMSFLPEERNHYIQKHRLLLQTMHQKAVNKWIIDLRHNFGGDWNSMFLSLSHFFKPGVVFTLNDFVAGFNDKKNTFSEYSYIPGPQEIPINLENDSVVILTDHETASSAEFLTAAFKRRPNTTIIGKETAGMTSVNSSFFLADGNVLNFTIGFAKDASGKVIPLKQKPDIFSVANKDSFFQLEKDGVVITAIQKLNRKLDKDEL